MTLLLAAFGDSVALHSIAAIVICAVHIDGCAGHNNIDQLILMGALGGQERTAVRAALTVHDYIGYPHATADVGSPRCRDADRRCAAARVDSERIEVYQ